MSARWGRATNLRLYKVSIAVWKPGLWSVQRTRLLENCSQVRSSGSLKCVKIALGVTECSFMWKSEVQSVPVDIHQQL